MTKPKKKRSERKHRRMLSCLTTGSPIPTLPPTPSPSNPSETPPSLEITSAQRVFYTPELIDEVCFFASSSALLGIMLTGSYGLTRGTKRLWRRTTGNLVDRLLKVRYSTSRTMLYRQSVRIIDQYHPTNYFEYCKILINQLFTCYPNLRYVSFAPYLEGRDVYWIYHLHRQEISYAYDNDTVQAEDLLDKVSASKGENLPSKSPLDPSCNVGISCQMAVSSFTQSGEIRTAIKDQIASIFGKKVRFRDIYVFPRQTDPDIVKELLHLAFSAPAFIHSIRVPVPWTELEIRHLLDLIGHSKVGCRVMTNVHIMADCNEQLFESFVAECRMSRTLCIFPTVEATPLPLGWVLEEVNEATYRLLHLKIGVTCCNVQQAQSHATLEELRHPNLPYLQHLTLYMRELPQISQKDFAYFLSRYIPSTCEVILQPWPKFNYGTNFKINDPQWDWWRDEMEDERVKLLQSVGSGGAWVQLSKTKPSDESS